MLVHFPLMYEFVNVLEKTKLSFLLFSLSLLLSRCSVSKITPKAMIQTIHGLGRCLNGASELQGCGGQFGFVIKNNHP